MRLSGTDLGAVLIILAGGAVGVSSSFLLLSRSDDEPGPVPVVASYGSPQVLRFDEHEAALLRIEELQEIVRFQKSLAYERQIRDRRGNP